MQKTPITMDDLFSSFDPNDGISYDNPDTTLITERLPRSSICLKKDLHYTNPVVDKCIRFLEESNNTTNIKRESKETIDDWSNLCRKSSYSYVEYNVLVFKNKFCAFCNYGREVEIKPLRFTLGRAYTLTIKMIEDKTTNRIWLSLNGQDQVTDAGLIRWQKGYCNLNNKVIQNGRSCAFISCSKDFSILRNGLCLLRQQGVFAIEMRRPDIERIPQHFIDYIIACKLRKVIKMENSKYQMDIHKSSRKQFLIISTEV